MDGLEDACILYILVPSVMHYFHAESCGETRLVLFFFRRHIRDLPGKKKFIAWGGTRHLYYFASINLDSLQASFYEGVAIRKSGKMLFVFSRSHMYVVVN